MQHTKRKANATIPEDPRAVAVKRLLTVAQLVRQRGTPEEADEALEWEKQLQARLKTIEPKRELQAA